jgi:hypothetical protein
MESPGLSAFANAKLAIWEAYTKSSTKSLEKRFSNSRRLLIALLNFHRQAPKRSTLFAAHRQLFYEI